MASPFDWISMGLGAVGNVASGFIANRANAKENEKNRQFNHAEAELAYNRSVQQWNRENAYNTPTAIRQRLSAAGVNPDLAFSGGMPNAVASFSSSPSASAPGAIPQSPVDFVNAFSTARLTAAQAENIEADSDKKFSETSILQNDAKWRDALNRGELQLKNALVVLHGSASNLNDQERENLRKELSLVEQNIENAKLTYHKMELEMEGLDYDNRHKFLNFLFDSKTFDDRVRQVASMAQCSEYEAQVYLRDAFSRIAVNYSQSSYYKNASLREAVEAQNAIIEGQQVTWNLNVDKKKNWAYDADDPDSKTWFGSAVRLGDKLFDWVSMSLGAFLNGSKTNNSSSIRSKSYNDSSSSTHVWHHQAPY